MCDAFEFLSFLAHCANPKKRSTFAGYALLIVPGLVPPLDSHWGVPLVGSRGLALSPSTSPKASQTPSMLPSQSPTPLDSAIPTPSPTTSQSSSLKPSASQSMTKRVLWQSADFKTVLHVVHCVGWDVASHRAGGLGPSFINPPTIPLFLCPPTWKHRAHHMPCHGNAIHEAHGVTT